MLNIYFNWQPELQNFASLVQLYDIYAESSSLVLILCDLKKKKL